jgi:hypothetical protein
LRTVTALRSFPARVAKVRAKLAPRTPIEVWCQDEMPVGQKNKPTYRWAKRAATRDGACSSEAVQLHLDDVATTAGTRSLISPGFIARTVGVKNRCKSAIAVLAAVDFKVGRPRNSIWDRWWVFCKARSVRRLRVHFDIFEKVLCVLNGCVVEFVRITVLVDEEL